MQPVTAAQQQTNTAGVPITSALRDFYKNIAGTPSSQQAEGDITSFNKLAPSSGDVLKAFDEQYGVNTQAQRVNQLRQSVMQAEDAVNNVDDNVFARTSNALVTDAQRARLVGAEKDPLVKQLGVISRNFDVAGQDLAGLREQSNRYSTAELGDISTMRGSLGERLGTAQQREEVERQRKQQEEQNRQWWENYYLEKSKTDAYIKNLQEQSAATRAQAATAAAQAAAIRASMQKAAAPAPKANPQQDADASYLGKLVSAYSGGELNTIINSLKNGNADAKRRYALGKQLGYF